MAKNTPLDFIDEANDNLKGFETVDASTAAIPFLKVLQKQGAFVEEGAPDHIPGAKAGMFVDPVNRTLLGDAIHVIVLQFERMYVEWLPDRGGFVEVHSVENAKKIAADTTFGKWKTASGNDLVENYVYSILVEGHEKEGLMLLSLTSSNIKKAKELNRSMMSHIMSNGERARPYYLVYRLSTERRTNSSGSWHGITFSFDHYITKDQYDLIKLARASVDVIDYAGLNELDAKTDSKLQIPESADEMEIY